MTQRIQSVQSQKSSSDDFFGSSEALLHSAVLYSVLSYDFCGLSWNMGKGEEGKKHQLQSAVELQRVVQEGVQKSSVVKKRQNVSCIFPTKKGLDSSSFFSPNLLWRVYLFNNFLIEKMLQNFLGNKIKKSS